MTNDEKLSSNKKLKHLLGTKNFLLDDIKDIFETVNMLKKQQQTEHQHLLSGKNICNVFFEASTRTLCSFELAAKKLGANIINFNMETSSTQKGETFSDTISTLNAMSFDAIVIRHPSGNAAEEAALKIGDSTSIINAGNGCNEHPTQALLDAYTILQHKEKMGGLKIAIVGDIEHSRVARSLIYILNHLGATNIVLIGPKNLIPKTIETNNTTIENNLCTGIKDCDVIVMLRIQKERMKATETPNPEAYFQSYGLTKERLSLAKKDAIVMHPGPVNRGIEITEDVIESEQSVILEQVKNGVFIRMAVMLKLLT